MSPDNLSLQIAIGIIDGAGLGIDPSLDSAAGRAATVLSKQCQLLTICIWF